MHAPDPIADDPVLAELAALVHETRPRLEPATANALDRRVAVALRNPDSVRRRRPVWLMPALGACASILLVVVIAVSVGHGGSGTSGGSAGSSGGGGGVSATSGGNEATRHPPPIPSDSSSNGAASGGASSGGGAAASSAPAPGRAVERSATLRMAVRPGRLDDAAAGAARVATGLGGYVASSTVSSGEGADLDLRVPSARVDQAIARLSQLGRVRDLQRGTLDITDQLTTARRHVQEDRAERRSLLRQLAAASTRREANRIRARLTVVTARLDRERAMVTELRRRADYAIVGVTIVPDRRHGTGAAAPWTPKDALHDAARVLEVAAGVALIALAVLVPIGLLGVPAWIAARRLARRRREHVLDFA